ncbi:MAG: phosphatidylinositol kinase [Gammaproteobacteria bacterium]|nr:MAG: phosphatidylinositol kinase [Gammaproteobacteria bacterium]
MANIDVYLKPVLREVGLNNPELSGRLVNELNKYIFAYHHGSSEALSLTMPLRAESYSFNHLHPIFQMNLPEGHLRQAIERATAKQYGSDDLTMLALLGVNQIGRLAYAIADQKLIDQNLATPDLKTLLASEDATLFNQLMQQFATSSGVAGVQPKVLLNLKTKATLPLQSYIVKSWGAEFPELGCNEMVCLTIARHAGLNVAEFHLSDNGKLLVSKRFDIQTTEIDDKTNNLSLGFEDFCVLQGKTTREKYDASLESCTNTIRQFVSPVHQQQALYDFFKLTLVNILVRNGDAHLKNSGVIYNNLKNYQQGTFPETERQLAPIFDIVSTIPYIANDTMALTLTGSKRWPKWKVLEQFARQHCGLNSKKIELAINEVKGAAERAFPLLDELSELHPEFENIADVIRLLIKQPF